MCVSGCVHDGLTKRVPVCMRQTGEQTLNHKVKDKYHWTKHTQTSVEMFAGVWENKKEKNKKKDILSTAVRETRLHSFHWHVFTSKNKKEKVIHLRHSTSRCLDLCTYVN